MKFVPKTEKEIEESSLLTEGEYDFEIISAIEGLSKTSGNLMTTVKLKFYDNGESVASFDDYLPAEGMDWKLRHFADSIGMLDQYETGEILPEFLPGKNGRCKIKIQPAKNQWKARNTVADYIPRKSVDDSDINF